MYECVYSVTVYGPHLRHSRGHCYVRDVFMQLHARAGKTADAVFLATYLACTV